MLSPIYWTGLIENRLNYNLPMRYVLLLGLLLFAACSARAAEGTPEVLTLRPYQTITASPTGLLPGELVVSFPTALPTPTAWLYTIVAGDTMGQIAEKFGVSLDALLAANPKIDPNAMPVGQTIQIPGNSPDALSLSTPTPVPLEIQQIACHPTADGGMWCFILAHNDAPSALENLSAQVSLIDAKGKSIASQTAFTLLDILTAGSSLPLATFFPAPVPSGAEPRVQILTATQLLPGDQRYVPATIQNSLVQVDWSGLTAQLSGRVDLPSSDAASASLIWVAATAFDSAGNVIGTSRWESKADIRPGGSLPFSFMVAGVSGTIAQVDFAVEARP